MAGPVKPKAAPAAAPAAAKPKKLARPKPDRTLTLEEATQRLAALDLEGLTEDDRRSAVMEIRARLEEQAHTAESATQALARRVLLLRLWHELVQLRVTDVRAEKKPPFEPSIPERMFPPVEGSEAKAEADAPQDPPTGETLAEALKPLTPKPFTPPEPDETELLVNVKLLKTEMVRGMRLPAGIIVSVHPDDAENLIESGKAVAA